MKKSIVHILIFAFLSLYHLNAQDLDGGKFPNLPNPLIAEDGRKVTDIATWENIRREELLNIFRDSVYGRSPQKGEYTCHFKIASITPIANGTAVRKMVEFAITGPKGTHTFELPVYIPKSSKKVPLFILMSHRARIADTIHNSEMFPLNNFLLPKGYGVAVINAIDFNEENAARYRTGLLEQFNMNGPYDWKSLSARTFVASRMIDYLETDTDVDVSRIAIIGHSRSGKAALWAGAQDKRIALTIPNNAGCAGDALYRNNSGQTLEAITRVYPRWFSDKYMDYSGKDLTIPFDSHELIALIAPRLIAQGVGSQDGGADPTGQFYAAVLAQPVFNLYGKSEIKWTLDDAPDRKSTENIVLENGNMHFHQRAGKHDLSLYDWEQYVDFADRMMLSKNPN